MAKEKESCQEVVAALETKVAEYEKLINEIVNTAPKRLGKIVNGPLVNNKITYYRVEAGNGQTLATYEGNLLFDAKKTMMDLTTGLEVVMVESHIIDVVPEQLAPKNDNKNTFKLIEWAEIGGLTSQIGSIREAIELPLLNEKVAKEFGLEPIKGILLYGPPGCGKTLVAKAIASMILKSNEGDEDSFVYIKGAELLSMYVGATEQQIISIFRQCRKYTKKSGKRAVIFIDEAEAILPARGSRRSSDVDKTIVPTFLSEMDGFDDNSPIMILSTNLPQDIDPAILREGRIDLKVNIARPNLEDVREIFAVHLKGAKCADEVKDLINYGTDKIFSSANLEKKVSGALVKTVVKTATQKAFARKLGDKAARTGITKFDFDNAFKEVNYPA